MNMSKNGSWINKGKDGENYESVDEMIGANNRWDQQQEQNKLLSQQNQLLAKQQKEKERLAREQMDNDRALEYSRQKHDREMRLLNLCDNIGISQEYMNSFLDYLNDESTAYEEEKDKLNKLDSDIKKLKDKSSELFDISYDSEHENESIKTQIKVLNEIKNMQLGNMEYCLNRDDTYDLLTSKINSLATWRVFAFIAGLLMIFTVILLLEGGGTTADWILGLLIVEIAVIVIYIIVRISNQGKIISICDEKIEKLNKSYKKIDKHNKDNVDDKYYKLEKEKEEIIHKYRNMKLKDFYEFRTKHYNSQVEKFLIDYGFKDRFGADFKVVTKSNSKSNGDVDDYIDYFNSVIDNK